MNSPVYLVVEPMEIIATDLAMNVSDYDTTATVLIALTLDAACEILKGHPAVRLAFVHADPTSFAQTDLARALEDRRAQVAFTGDAAERKGSGMLVLHRPFSAETTAKLLLSTEESERA